MNDNTQTIIRPLSAQLKRLQQNTGLTHYTVNGLLTLETVMLVMTSLDIWTFWYVDIVEPEVREHMLRETMGKRNMSKEEALDYLYRVRSGIPKDQVEVEVIRS